MKNRINNFRGYFEFKQPKPEDLKKDDMKILMNYQIEKIKNFYKILERRKSVDTKLLTEIIDFTKNMPFFIKFDNETKKLLFQNSKLKIYDRGDYVVKQGEIGDCMFVILYGSCNVLIKKKHPETNKLYDFVKKFIN